jgi:hypothetical protein
LLAPNPHAPFIKILMLIPSSSPEEIDFNEPSVYLIDNSFCFRYLASTNFAPISMHIL